MGLDIYLFSQTENDERQEIAYFRKFNAFWSWVDEHVTKVENCVDIPISKGDFINLRNTLNRLNKNNCNKLLPTQCGFFFGSQEYDDWYWQDIEKLKELVKNTLANFNFDTGKIHFIAWW